MKSKVLILCAFRTITRLPQGCSNLQSPARRVTRNPQVALAIREFTRMTTNQLETTERSIPAVADGVSQNFASEIYGNMSEARRMQQQLTSNGDTTNSALKGFGNLELFDSTASLQLKDGAGNEIADRAPKIKRDDQGRPTEVDGTKYHYGPDGKVNRVDFPKGSYEDGGDTVVKGADGKWRDTKNNRVKDHFDVTVNKDGTTSITQEWNGAIHTDVKNPDGSLIHRKLDDRGYAWETEFAPDGKAYHWKVTNPDGKVVEDEHKK